MNVKVFDLNNKIKVAYMRSQTEVVHIGLMVGVGSRNDEKQFLGFSHFVEHMWFKGTNRRTSMQIINDIEKLGGDFNAYTSKEETCVHISILKDSFPVALDVLSDIYYNSTFPACELEKEREVIVDEIDSYEDSPSELIFDEFEEYLYKESSLSYPILGTRESLSEISSEVMIEQYDQKFLEAKLVVSFVGNVPFEIFEKELRNTFLDINVRSMPLIDSGKIHKNDSFNIVRHKKTSQAHCVLGCEAYSWDSAYRLPLAMLSTILGGPQFSSILSYSLREKHGLTYNVESVYTPYSDSGSLSIYFGTEKKKVETCLAIIKEEFKRICNTDLFNNEIEGYKKQLLGQLALSYENNLNLMLSHAKSVLVFNKVESFNVISKKVQSIDASVLKNIANELLQFDKMSILLYN